MCFSAYFCIFKLYIFVCINVFVSAKPSPLYPQLTSRSLIDLAMR